MVLVLWLKEGGMVEPNLVRPQKLGGVQYLEGRPWRKTAESGNRKPPLLLGFLESLCWGSHKSAAT